nr:MAG: terminase large subunit [Caudoviricetes sp.]
MRGLVFRFKRFDLHGLQRIQCLRFGNQAGNLQCGLGAVPHLDLAKTPGHGHGNLLFDGGLRQVPQLALTHTVMETAAARTQTEAFDEMHRPPFFGQRVDEVHCRTALRLHGNLTNRRPALTKQVEIMRNPQHAVTACDQLHVRQPVRTHSGSGHIRGLTVRARVHGQDDTTIVRNRGTRVDAAGPQFRTDERNNVRSDPLAQDFGAESGLGHAVNIGSNAHDGHRPIAERRIRLANSVGIIHRTLVRRRPLEIAERSILLAGQEHVGRIATVGAQTSPLVNKLAALVHLLAKRHRPIIASVRNAPQLTRPNRLRGLADSVPAIISMLLTQLIEHDTGSALRANVLIRTDNISGLRAGDDRLLAVRVDEFLRHRGEIRDHQIRFLIGRRLRIAPLLDLIVRTLGIIKRLGRADHKELHGRHPVRMLIGIDEKPPCGQNAHQRCLAILAGDKHDDLAETVTTVLKQFERMDEQPLLPRIQMYVQHDFRERDHRETIARLPRQRPERRREDTRQGHAMMLIVDGAENLQILSRHRTPLF